MNNCRLSKPMSRLIAGASLLLLVGCNKQPNPAANGAAAVAPPIAALPLAAAPAAPAAPAPPASALPPPPRRLSFAPPPPGERYGYIDRAYSMGDAFAGTPPDYTVDYQGTRPWIWRTGNGAYRIVERLPRGERVYYFGPGEDQPFLIRDPEYSYAYDRGRLVGVYGPDGQELDGPMAAQRTDEASRYFDRSHRLYRAAQYQPRRAAYASAWTARRDDLRAEQQRWQEQQSRNSQWRAWSDAHHAQDASQWQQEREQRLAYATAIGIAATSSGSLPSPDELARRQAAYLANRKQANGQALGPNPVASGPVREAARENRTSAPPPVVKGPATPAQNTANGQKPVASVKPMKGNPAQMAQAQQAAADARRKEAAAAEAKAVQSANAQQAAAEAKRKEAAAAEAKAVQSANAQHRAAEVQSKEASVAQTKAAQAARTEKAAIEMKQKGSAAAQVKAVPVAQPQKALVQAKQREAAAARATAASAEQAAAEARQKEASAARAKAAQAAQAQKAAAEAKQHQAAAEQAKAEGAKAEKAAPHEAPPKPQAPAAKPSQNGSKAKGEQKKKDHPAQQQ